MTGVFGAEYAGAYDAIYAEKDYEAEVDLIERAAARFGDDAAASVLDLGCGTGGHAIPLARRGHRVTGVDRSPAMLAAVDALQAQGLVLGQTFGLGALDCDVGAADALKRPGEHVAAAAYFASEADARSFAQEQATPALGVVQIKAMCRD